MKKALLLAMMLVLALSVAASADDYGKVYLPQTPLGSHLDGNEVTRGFNVDITVYDFVYIGTLSEEPMIFDLDSPAAMGESYSIRRPFIFGTNTPVKVSLSETFTGTFPATSALHTAVGLQKFSKATKVTELVGMPGSNYAMAIYNFPAGKHEGLLNVAVGWYNTDKIAQEDGNWDDLPWWEVLAGRYGGTVTLTIEPLDPVFK
ncbi:MAG: hypothetical protein GX855_01005 [Firmicutes bacterium]|jgi:hypothetical protein|nr:hypothetical protein [Bacillota bacterium]